MCDTDDILVQVLHLTTNISCLHDTDDMVIARINVAILQQALVYVSPIDR